MSTMTLAHSWVDGDVQTPTELNENFSNSPTTSFLQINGYLDENNMAAQIDRELLKRRQFTGGQMVGKTLNIDYFPYLFTGFSPSGGVTPLDSYVPVLGTGASFHLPRQATVVVMSWTMAIANDQDALTEAPYLHFRVDGTRKSHSDRNFPHAVITVGGTVYRKGAHRDRAYCGHHTQLNMAAGWHDCALFLAHAGSQARVRCASLKIFWGV